LTSRCEFASDGIRQLLAVNGLHDLESALAIGEQVDAEHHARATRHTNKAVVTLNLQGADQPTRVYIKRQWKRERLLPRWTDLRHRTAVQCSPIHEWRGLQILKKAGFHVSEPLAVFWHGWGFSRGAVVTQAVPPKRSLADMIDSGEFKAMTGERRDALIQAAVGVVAKLYHRRISWRSMKVKHFYPEEIAPNSWRIWLIDCEGISKWALRRDCHRDWRGFLRYINTHVPSAREEFQAAYKIVQTRRSAA
jgi:hypothetical protein